MVLTDLSGSFKLALDLWKSFERQRRMWPATGNGAMLPARRLPCQYLHLGGIT
jgi:hypothetical protein